MAIAIVQRAQANAGVLGSSIAGTFGATPGAGNLLVGVCNLRKGATLVSWPAGWTERFTVDQQNPTGAGGNGTAEGMSLATRIAGAGEPTIVTPSGGSFDRRVIQLWEISGGAYHSSNFAQAAGAPTLGAVTPPIGTEALLLGIFHWFEAVARSADPAGYTFDQQQAGNTGSDSDMQSAWRQAIASASGGPYSGTVGAAGAAFGTGGQVAIIAGGPALPSGFYGQPGGAVW